MGAITKGLSLAALFAGLTAWPAAAQTPPELRDLIGARAAGGETQLQARGWRNVRGETGDDRVWTYWWNARTRQCITVATVNGRYDAITLSPAPDCRQSGAGEGDRPRPPRPGDEPRPLPTRPGDDRPVPGGSWSGGQPVSFGLICFGEGRRPALANRYGWVWNDRRDRYDFGSSVELSNQDFDAAVTVQLWEDGGRIRLARELIPPIHSRDGGDWWQLSNVSASGRTITAQYRLNGLNRPRMTIDRRSGRIEIIGAANYRFRGTCDPIDGSDHWRF